MVKNKIALLLTVGILLAVSAGVYINVSAQRAVDHSKLPQKVELSKGFQKWITNLKNKGFDINADDFRLMEEVQIYNTKWIKIYSLDAPGMQDTLVKELESHKTTDHTVFSPSGKIFIDYRSILRDGYNSNEVRLYGQKEDKIIDARVADCSARANCYFDRAYFLDNDVFVISEISRTIDKKDEQAPLCSTADKCQYSFKVHVVDLINNNRAIYESKPFDAVLDKVLPNL